MYLVYDLHNKYKLYNSQSKFRWQECPEMFNVNEHNIHNEVVCYDTATKVVYSGLIYKGWFKTSL